jgi:hypothetical protein
MKLTAYAGCHYAECLLCCVTINSIILNVVLLNVTWPSVTNYMLFRDKVVLVGQRSGRESAINRALDGSTYPS